MFVYLSIIHGAIGAYLCVSQREIVHCLIGFESCSHFEVSNTNYVVTNGITGGLMCMYAPVSVPVSVPMLAYFPLKTRANAVFKLDFTMQLF